MCLFQAPRFTRSDEHVRVLEQVIEQGGDVVGTGRDVPPIHVPKTTGHSWRKQFAAPARSKTSLLPAMILGAALKGPDSRVARIMLPELGR